MANTVLVTGGAGFIGSHTVKELQRCGFFVIILDRKEKPQWFDGLYYQCDVNNLREVEQIFKNNDIDFVLHLAAMPSVSESCRNPQVDCYENYLATVNICSLSKKYSVKKFVFSSTAAVYANPQYLPVDENHPTGFLSPYAITKFASENFIKYIGIDYIIFRYSNVYGAGQNSDGEAGVVSIFFDKMINKRKVTIYGNGEQTRDFVYVKDIAKVNTLAFLMDIKNEIINVSSNSSISINKLFFIIKNSVGYDILPNYSKKRTGDIKHSILDNHKLINLMKICPSVNISENIEEMKTFICK